VTAAMDDGSTLDVSAIVNWVIEDTSVAMVSADGLVYGIAAGSTRLQADLDGETAEPIMIDVVSDAIADLWVASTDGVVDGGLLLLTVDVENQGNGSAEGFWVDIFVDPIVPPIVGDIGDSFVWVDAVAGGVTERLDFTVPVSQGTHSVVVFVDTEDVIEESVEQNNTASVTIHPPAQGADLVIDTVDWFVDETNVVLDVLVRNAGDADADRVFIDYFLDQSDAPAVFDFGDGYDTVGPLGPQETQWISWMTVASCDPECSAWILVDSLDEVEESDESNNVHGPSVVVSSVPLDTGWW
jgi:subtilase family serine protease